MTWRTEALCIGRDESFFAADERAACRICAGCPVIAECLSYAVTTGQRFGVWGGIGEDERRSLRRRWLQTVRAGVPVDPYSLVAGELSSVSA